MENRQIQRKETNDEKDVAGRGPMVKSCSSHVFFCILQIKMDCIRSLKDPRESHCR